jgi:hypothetical protein
MLMSKFQGRGDLIRQYENDMPYRKEHTAANLVELTSLFSGLTPNQRRRADIIMLRVEWKLVQLAIGKLGKESVYTKR